MTAWRQHTLSPAVIGAVALVHHPQSFLYVSTAFKSNTQVNPTAGQNMSSRLQFNTEMNAAKHILYKEDKGHHQSETAWFFHMCLHTQTQLAPQSCVLNISTKNEVLVQKNPVNLRMNSLFPLPHF